MTPDDDQLLEYLRGRWDELLRLTTLEQGMAALGRMPDDARRLRVGDFLFAHPETHPTLERWGARTFILTEDEKLLGRRLTQWAVEHRGRICTADAAVALARSEAAVGRALDVLQHIGLLRWYQGGDAIDFTLPQNWHQLAGPLGFTFHTVQLEGGERFNVP